MLFRSLDGLLSERGHAVINAGVSRSLDTMFRKCANGELADTMESFQFPLGPAVTEFFCVVGNLHGGR